MREEAAVNDSWIAPRVGEVIPTPLQHCTGSAQHQRLLQWCQSISAAGRQEPGRGGCLWLLSSWAAQGPVHAGIFLGLRSGSWKKSQEKQLQVLWHLSVLCPPKQRAACRQHQLKCQSGLSSALRPDRRRKKALSSLWNIWIQEYLVPAKPQTSCGNTHKWQGKHNSLWVKFLYLHRKVSWEKAERRDLNKRKDLIAGGQ